MEAIRTNSQFETYKIKTARGTFFLAQQVRTGGFSDDFMVVSGRTMHPSRINGVGWFSKKQGEFVPSCESLRTFSIAIK